MIENGAQNSCRYSVSVEFAQWLVVKVSVLLLCEVFIRSTFYSRSYADGVLIWLESYRVGRGAEPK
jgi:hypothetical protein